MKISILAALCVLSATAGAAGVLNEDDVKEPYAAPKAVVLKGAVYDGSSVAGIVELKLGKVDKKKTSRVSGSVIGLDGRKHAIKPFPVADIDGTSPKAAALEVKDLGTMNVTIGGARFAGSLGGLHVQSADVGGDWTQEGAVVNVRVPAADRAAFAGVVVEGLLPAGEPVIPSGGKWKFAKAAGVKWTKLKDGAAPFGGLVDAASGKGLLVDTSKGRSNLSAMKLTYAPRNGTFKGLFKVYALEGSGAKTRLRQYTVKVSGLVAGGEGCGVAVCKRPAVLWPVSVCVEEKVQLWKDGPYWATKNLGAENPEDCGLYFWWGDTTGHRPSSGVFDFDFSDANPAIYTYGRDAAQLKADGWLTSDGVLAPDHDAAHVLWGGKWRLPTDRDMISLLENCDWVATVQKGVHGYAIRGRGAYASASIFLPCAGYGDGASLLDADTYGRYWASTPGAQEDDFTSAGYCEFSWSAQGPDTFRCNGHSIRPVQGFAE